MDMLEQKPDKVDGSMNIWWETGENECKEHWDGVLWKVGKNDVESGIRSCVVKWRLLFNYYYF